MSLYACLNRHRFPPPALSFGTTRNSAHKKAGHFLSKSASSQRMCVLNVSGFFLVEKVFSTHILFPRTASPPHSAPCSLHYTGVELRVNIRLNTLGFKRINQCYPISPQPPPLLAGQVYIKELIPIYTAKARTEGLNGGRGGKSKSLFVVCSA